MHDLLYLLLIAALFALLLAYVNACAALGRRAEADGAS